MRCFSAIKLSFACIIFIFLSTVSSLHGETVSEQDSLKKAFQAILTEEEITWLQEHQEISLGTMAAWAPMNFVDEYNHQPTGIGIDYARALETRLGIRFIFIPAPFQDNLTAIAEQRLDAMMDVTPKPERAEYMNFTREYLNIPHVIVGTIDGPIFASEEDLKGYTIALEEGFYNVRYFKEKYPSITIKEYPDTERALGAVSRHEADAYVGNRAVAMWIAEQELISNLQIHGRADKPGSLLTIGIRKDWPLFTSILNKALNNISNQEVRSIHQKWTGFDFQQQVQSQIQLSFKERAWLINHRGAQIGIGNTWEPFVYQKADDTLEGLDVDILEEINQLTGAQLKLVAGPWKDIVSKAQNKKIDGLAESAVVDSRREHFLFTEPYNIVEYAAATLPEHAAIVHSKRDLNGKRIAYLKGNIWTSKIVDSIENAKPIFAPSEIDAFRLVIEGKADFALIPVHQFIPLRKIYHQSLTFTHIFDEPEYQLQAVYSIRKDWPELVSIINKALAAVDERKMQEIYERWIPATIASDSLELSQPEKFNISQFLLKTLGGFFTLLHLFSLLHG